MRVSELSCGGNAQAESQGQIGFDRVSGGWREGKEGGWKGHCSQQGCSKIAEAGRSLMWGPHQTDRQTDRSAGTHSTVQGVVFPVASVTHCHKRGDLKQHTCVLFTVLDVRSQNSVSLG